MPGAQETPRQAQYDPREDDLGRIYERVALHHRNMLQEDQSRMFGLIDGTDENYWRIASRIAEIQRSQQPGSTRQFGVVQSQPMGT